SWCAGCERWRVVLPAGHICPFLATDARDVWRHSYCVEPQRTGRTVPEGETGVTAEPPDLPLRAAFTGVITSPSETMERIARECPWDLAVALAVGIALASSLVDLAKPFPPSDAETTPALILNMLRLGRTPAFILGWAVFGMPLCLVINSLIAFLWARMLGGEGSFRGLLATQSFAMVPIALVLP